MSGICLTRGDAVSLDFWSEVEAQYKEGIHCDVRINCGLGMDGGGGGILCHGIVLTAASATFRGALLSSSTYFDEDATTVKLPDYNEDDVRRALDSLYSFLSGRSDGDAFFDEFNPSRKLFAKCSWKAKVSSQNQKVELKLEVGDGEEDEEGFVGDAKVSLVRKRRKRRRGQNRGTRATKKERQRDIEQDLKEATSGSDEDDFEAEQVGEEEDCGAVGEEKRARPRPEVRKKMRRGTDSELEEDTWHEEDRKELYRLMKERDSSLVVRPLDKPLVHAMDRYELEASAFQALVALRRDPAAVAAADPSSPMQCLPLAWSLPTSAADIEEQFDSVSTSLRSVFGFSESDVCYNGLLYSRQGLSKKNRSKKVRYELRRRLAAMTHQQMLEALEKREITDVVARTEPKRPAFDFGDGAQTRQLKLTGEFTPAEADGVALLVWEVEGEVDAPTARVLVAGGMDLENEANEFLKCLFHVWCVGRPEPYIPQSEHLGRKYDALMKPMETKKILEEFLAGDPDGTQRREILTKTKECPECGTVFPGATLADDLRFTAHKRNHQYENFRCDCAGVEPFASLAQKVAHIRLEHSGGKYVRCGRCNFVGTSSSVEKHEEREHSGQAKRAAAAGTSAEGTGVPGGCVCETCGKVLNDPKALYMHMLIHKTYRCEVCLQEVVGYSAFQTHKRNAHPDEKVENLPCEVCGKTFPSKQKLKVHFIRMHMEDKDRPYQCPDCDRGFAVSRALSAHRMMAHIKSRPYACRYGCGAAYNDHSSRGTHEKKKHGGKFPADKAPSGSGGGVL